MAPRHAGLKKTEGSLAKQRADANELIYRSQSSYVVLYEAAPEGGYVAVVPALPGCHSQGDTLEEAADNIQEAIEVYLESVIAHGEPIPKETQVFQGIVTVDVPVRRNAASSRS